MKKIRIILCAALIFVMSFSMVFAAKPIEDNLDAFGYYYGTFCNKFVVPAYTGSYGTYPSYTIPYKTSYRVSYNLNTGEIVSAEILNHTFDPQDIFWDYDRAKINSISTVGTPQIKINGSDVTFQYTIRVGINYYAFEAGPSETITRDFSQSKTVTNIDRP